MASPLLTRNRIAATQYSPLRTDASSLSEQSLLPGRIPTGELKGKAIGFNDGVDRSDWKKRAFASHADLLDLKQRVDPLARALSFVEIYQPERKGVRLHLSRQAVIQLIIQHLHSIGLKASAVALEKEAQVRYVSHGRSDSQLLKLLHRSIRTVEEIYDYTVEDERPDLNHDYIDHLIYDLSLVDVEEHGETIRDVNIWEEPDDDKTQIHEPNGELRAGTLNKLVTKLTGEKEADMVFLKSFMMTYQSFTTPEKLLSKLIERFNIPPELEGTRGTTIQLRVCNVIKKWIEEYYADFDQNLIDGITSFVNQLGRLENRTMDALRLQILKTMEKMKQRDQLQKRKMVFKEQPQEPKVNIKTIFSPKLSFFDVDEEELARQLCLIEYEIYASIRPQELLNQSWSKPKLKHRSPNVLRLIHFFNSVSNWVAASIIQMPKVKERAKVMSKFIRMAEHLRALKNFNSTMAITAAMNVSAVARLHWTKKELPTRFATALADLEKLMNSEGSYRNYRQTINGIEPPCIPYLGVYLTDLVFIDENPDYVSGLINYAKRKLINQVIMTFAQFQHVPYNIQPVYQILSLLNKLPSMEEQELYVLSLAREPRKAQRHEIQ